MQTNLNHLIISLIQNVMSVQSAMLDLDPNALVVAVGSEYMLLSAISSKNLANVEILLHSNANAGLKAPFSTLAKALVQAQNVPMGIFFFPPQRPVYSKKKNSFQAMSLTCLSLPTALLLASSRRSLPLFP